MEEITDHTIVLARLIKAHFWKEGLSFFSEDKDFIQAGTWKYQRGKKLLAHIHNIVERKINRTQEVIYIKKGKVEASIYNLRGKLIKKVIANQGDFLILLNSGHGYEILEDDTQVLEIKNGPYLGPDIDRKRI